MRYRAVVFDLDGTLLDTLEDLADAMNAVLVREGRKPHAPDAYRRFVGDGMERLARRALGAERGQDDLVWRCVAGMEEEYARCWNCKTHPYPGVPEMLDALRARGVPKAVLSNKPEPFVRLAVERFLDGWNFAPIRGAAPGFPRKPDPRGALEIARTMGLSPRNLLYLGDSDTDMLTARAAGMCAVGATWGFRGAAELIRSGAAHVLTRPLDLLDLLGPQE